ncbi:Mss4-like protein [Xylariaceae sp. FL1651]|nr:Mss4-like protein [Xylariaceae sp. FL1651]
MAGEEAPIVNLIAQCLCQAHRFRAGIPHSSLPLEVTYCHCNSCRHVTGAMYSDILVWPGDSTAIRESSLRRYIFSEKLTILFCGVCSSTMFFEKKEAGDDNATHGVLTGVLTNVNVPGLAKITDHIFLGDTLDGGASPWLRSVQSDGSQPRLWKGRKGQSEELPSNWPSGNDLPDAPVSTEANEIPIRCHCGGVDLVYRQLNAEFAALARSELPWFIDPDTNKSLGGFDACDSCRLSSGIDIFHWTFVLLRHLAFPKLNREVQPGFPQSSIELKAAVSMGKNRDPRWGTLAFHESSSDVERYFCSRCSACVFYAAHDRPDLVDLAIGLIESPDGARAEGLVSWDFGGKMIWRQDVAGGWREDFIKRVESEAERWRIDRGYPKNWRRIQKEEAAMKMKP